ncbi:hypothetical protein AK812_SmicGene3643 [Symbiodinium microadriaticum]|uniref:Uncharacterized protein n=1 Tax=Symbiodinium microadriaticum TaxID=2951 RepID=A0A1Q9EYC2_SYMMI|nr:hypothetical protein AK812_SmicGene3643 [Symbiodinium microadriaticum]
MLAMNSEYQCRLGGQTLCAAAIYLADVSFLLAAASRPTVFWLSSRAGSPLPNSCCSSVMQRSETQGLASFDGRVEQILLRRAADAEARCRRIMEGKRQAITERQLQLQSQVTAAEEALRREKEAALELQTEVSLERWELQQSAGG